MSHTGNVQMQGRESSRRKARGRKCAPRRLTADGNADRIRAFDGFGSFFQKGLLYAAQAKKGVITTESAEKYGIFMGLYQQRKKEFGLEETNDKCKFPLWIRPETRDEVKKLYRAADCRSQSEFIEKAIRFYIGYITAENDESFLPNAFLSTMKSIVAESDNRQDKMLFRLSVELAMVMNILASMQEVDEVTLNRLRGECVKEVKRLNGNFTFDDALRWQKG